MSPLVSRLTLCLAGLICMGISFCCSLLYMSHIAASGLSTEIADSSTTIQRRAEIAQGLDNAAMLQSRLANTGWWLSLAAILLIGVVVMWGFRGDSRR